MSTCERGTGLPFAGISCKLVTGWRLSESILIAGAVQVLNLMGTILFPVLGC